MNNNRIESYIKRVLALFISKDLSTFSTELVRRNYNLGMNAVDSQLKLSFNPVQNTKTIDFLRQYTFENIKGMKDDIAIKLRQEMVQAFQNREGNADIKKRVRKVMGVARTRANAIARTESTRAFNAGGKETADQSGLNLVKKVYNPNPKSDICKALVKRKPIDMDDKWSYNGEEYALPPFHVNCRSKAMYEQVKS